MDGRTSVLTIALTLMVTGLSGCIQGADWLNSTDAEVSAFANKRVADDAARAWNADAVLVGVLAFELSKSDDARISEDVDPGNGLAPAWWYAYAANGATRAWKVSADGVLSTEDEANAMALEIGHEHAEEIHDWNVDSDAAIAAAKTDASFRRIAEGFNATVVEGVAHTDGISQWWISAMSADGFVIAMVDADTGELLGVQPLDFDFDIPAFDWGVASAAMVAPPVHLEGEGELMSGEYEEYPFSLAAPMWGTLDVSSDNGMPTSSLGWVILDDEDEKVEHGRIGGMRGGDGEQSVELELEPGEYTLVVYHRGLLPIPTPIDDGVQYWVMLHLEPGMGHMHDHDDDEDDG